MTPMFHWVPRRIETHVKICVLALLIERVAEITCKEPWSRIRRALEGVQISQFQSREYRFFRRNEISTTARKTLKALSISIPKLVMGLKKLP
jgi:transposase